jgi:hypothetical protein
VSGNVGGATSELAKHANCPQLPIVNNTTGNVMERNIIYLITMMPILTINQLSLIQNLKKKKKKKQAMRTLARQINYQSTRELNNHQLTKATIRTPIQKSFLP